MQNGGKMPMTGALFKLLSDCEAEFFEAHYEKILAKQVSLNEVMKSSAKVSDSKSSKVNLANEAKSARLWERRRILLVSS